MIQRTHKVRIYPNKAQEEVLRKTVGTTRYAYNWGLEKWEELYKKGERCSAYTLSRLWTEERPEWAKETSRKPQVRAFMHLEGAFKAFFRGQNKYPKFKSKAKSRKTFYVGNDEGKLYPNHRIQIPRVGHVKMVEDFRYPDSKIMSMIVSYEAGSWYVFIKCELPDTARTDSTSVVGVDVGIKHWAVASDGTVCDSPKSLKHYERQLKRKQRLLARKQKGSKRREKAKLAVSKAYQKIQNIKLDTIHKFTSTIAKNHGVVVVEDLDVKDMKSSENKHIRRGVQNSCMSEMRRQLLYKCNNHIKVDRYFPSSKTCSNCGNVKDNLTLSNRSYQCHSCGFTIDRDLNAALNLRNKGLEIISGRSDR